MSRFLDERGRIFGKVSVVDILVLLVIIAVVAFAAVRMTGSSTATVPVKVTYAVEAVRQATVDKLRQGVKVKGTVRDDGGTVLGTAAEVVVKPTLEEFPNSDGQPRASDSPVFSDVSIVVLGEGQVSGSTVRIGGVTLPAENHPVTLTVNGYEVRNATRQDVTWGAEALK